MRFAFILWIITVKSYTIKVIHGLKLSYDGKVKTYIQATNKSYVGRGLSGMKLLRNFITGHH